MLPFHSAEGLITDITLWTECYALLVAVLATKHPSRTPHFMGYMRTIVRASCYFEGAAWASYDADYRRQAANKQSLDWETDRHLRGGHGWCQDAAIASPIPMRRENASMPREKSHPRRSSSGQMPGEPDSVSARTPGW